MLAKEVPSIGNEPNNIANEDVLDQTEANLRLGQVRELQERIDQIRNLTIRKGDAVNRARHAIIVIPAATIAGAALLYLTSFLVDDLPSVFRL